jgi:AcrR family transcriptional regulator
MAMKAAQGSRSDRRSPGPRRTPEEQRAHIKSAMAELVAKRGYQGTSVELVLQRAGISRKTFYAYFSNREECLLACLDEAAEMCRARILAAIEPEEDWADQIRAGLAAFLDLVAAQPAVARTCLVESMTAGPRALERYEAALKSFAPLLRCGRGHRTTSSPLPEILEDTLVGGIVWMVHRRLLAGEVEAIRPLLPRMVKFVLTPYVGERRATEIAGAPAAGTPRAQPPGRVGPPAVAARVSPQDRIIGEGRPVRMRPLPSGGGLPPDVVAHDQRQRILTAMIACVAERGYNQTSVAEVISLASVSRQTFYEQFGDKEDCFLAAYDSIVARLDRVVLEAAAGESAWPAMVAAAITALLGFLADNPDLARVSLLEVAAVGAGSAERREQDAARFNALIAIGRTQLAGGAEPQEGAEEALFGGVTTLLTRRVAMGEIERLDRDAPGLVEFVLTPFVGAEAAAAAASAHPPGDRASA